MIDHGSPEEQDGLLSLCSICVDSGRTISLGGEPDLANAATLSVELEQVEKS